MEGKITLLRLKEECDGTLPTEKMNSKKKKNLLES